MWRTFTLILCAAVVVIGFAAIVVMKDYGGVVLMVLGSVSFLGAVKQHKNIPS